MEIRQNTLHDFKPKQVCLISEELEKRKSNKKEPSHLILLSVLPSLSERIRFFLAHPLYWLAELIAGKNNRLHKKLHKEKIIQKHQAVFQHSFFTLGKDQSSIKSAIANSVPDSNDCVDLEEPSSILFGGEAACKDNFNASTKNRLAYLLNKENLNEDEKEEIKAILNFYEDDIVFTTKGK